MTPHRFVAFGWGGLLLGALLSPGSAGPWVSAMTVPIAGAGFCWGPGGALALAALSSLAVVMLVGMGAPAAWITGPLVAFCSFPVIFWIRWSRLEAELSQLGRFHRALEERLAGMSRQRQEQGRAIRSEETVIQGISELYGLSKQFLATLDLEQALRISEEALARGAPQMDARQRAAYLRKVRSLVEGGEVSMEALVSALPSVGTVLGSWEKGGTVIGQLALGLKRVSLYRQVQESAIHDGLTGLLVRRHFRERLEEEVERALRRKVPLAFLMVDLDRFKQINDTYGHPVGDLVLREVARRIQRSIREVDLVGRYGGEEFAVVLPEADRGLGVQIADRIREPIAQAPIEAYDERVPCTVSIGVALYPDDADRVDPLIEQADRAMYQAKEQGRNRTVAVGAAGG